MLAAKPQLVSMVLPLVLPLVLPMVPWPASMSPFTSSGGSTHIQGSSQWGDLEQQVAVWAAIEAALHESDMGSDMAHEVSGKACVTCDCRCSQMRCLSQG